MTASFFSPVSDFADRLRDAREAKRLTQAALARLAGVDRKTVVRYENGDSEPYRRNSDALAAALGVDGDWLASGVGRMSPPEGHTPHETSGAPASGAPAGEPFTVPDVDPALFPPEAPGAYLITFTGPHGEIMRARVRIELEQTGPPIEVGVGVAASRPAA